MKRYSTNTCCIVTSDADATYWVNRSYRLLQRCQFICASPTAWPLPSETVIVVLSRYMGRLIYYCPWAIVRFILASYGEVSCFLIVEPDATVLLIYLLRHGFVTNKRTKKNARKILIPALADGKENCYEGSSETCTVQDHSAPATTQKPSQHM